MYTAAIIFLYVTGMLSYLSMVMRGGSLGRHPMWRIGGILLWPATVIFAYIAVLIDTFKPRPRVRFTIR